MNLASFAYLLLVTGKDRIGNITAELPEDNTDPELAELDRVLTQHRQQQDEIDSTDLLYRAFPAPEARRVLRKLEFHYMPKHASWLNMVETEIGNINQQCLDRRIDSMELLKSEVAAWETRRNEERASVSWLFDVDKARTKLHRAYDKLTSQN